MTTTQRIRERATDLGYTWNQEPTGGGRETMTVYAPATVDVRMAAYFAQGRFTGGYTVDSTGHVMHHDTVSDLLRFAE